MRFEHQPKRISCLGKWLIDDNYQCFVKYQDDLQAPSTSCVLVADSWEDNGDFEGQRKLKNLTQKLVQSSYV